MADTQATSLITDAYREGNITAVGATPSVAQQTEALALLNRFIQGVFGDEMGEELTDWLVPAPQRTASEAANYPQLPYPQGLDGIALTSPLANSPTLNVYPYPPSNSRIVFGSVANTVWFPEQPNDGARMSVVQGSGAGDGGVGGATLTLDGNGRTIEGQNTQAYNQPVAGRQWLYRADLGDWKAVLQLGLIDTCPFPFELDDLWITMLAIRLAPRYNKVVQKDTMDRAAMMLKKLKIRYRQTGNTVYGSTEFPRALESFIAGNWFW